MSAFEESIRKYRKGYTLELDTFFYRLCNPEADEDTIVACLTELRQCVFDLGKDLEDFVKATLKLKWQARTPQLSSEYKSYILHLLSAHSYYVQPCVNKLVSAFFPTKSKSSEAIITDDEEAIQEACYRDVHLLLQAIVKIVPLAPSVIIQQISSSSPHQSRPARIQVHFLQNVLHVTVYVPSLRAKILELVISKLLQTDTMLAREDAIDLHDKASQANSTEEIFEIDEVITG